MAKRRVKHRTIHSRRRPRLGARGRHHPKLDFKRMAIGGVAAVAGFVGGNYLYKTVAEKMRPEIALGGLAGLALLSQIAVKDPMIALPLLGGIMIPAARRVADIAGLGEVAKFVELSGDDDMVSFDIRSPQDAQMLLASAGLMPGGQRQLSGSVDDPLNGGVGDPLGGEEFGSVADYEEGVYSY